MYIITYNVAIVFIFIVRLVYIAMVKLVHIAMVKLVHIAIGKLVHISISLMYGTYINAAIMALASKVRVKVRASYALRSGVCVCVCVRVGHQKLFCYWLAVPIKTRIYVKGISKYFLDFSRQSSIVNLEEARQGLMNRVTGK